MNLPLLTTAFRFAVNDILALRQRAGVVGSKASAIFLDHGWLWLLRDRTVFVVDLSKIGAEKYPLD
jgi:hypothetical protein